VHQEDIARFKASECCGVCLCIRRRL